MGNFAENLNLGNRVRPPWMPTQSQVSCLCKNKGASCFCKKKKGGGKEHARVPLKSTSGVGRWRAGRG